MTIWTSAMLEEQRIWLSVNLENRRVTFCYELDSEGSIYRFSLLSECRDDVQYIFNTALHNLDIGTLKVYDAIDYYTIVTSCDFLTFER